MRAAAAAAAIGRSRRVLGNATLSFSGRQQRLRQMRPMPPPHGFVTASAPRRDKGVVRMLKQMLAAGQANSKPLDTGTALILGAPAAAALGIYVWKQDTENLRPLREKKRREAAERAAAELESADRGDALRR